MHPTHTTQVKELVAKAYAHCKSTLEKNRGLLDELTEALIEKESVDFGELYDMVEGYAPEIVKKQKANFPPELGAGGTPAPA